MIFLVFLSICDSKCPVNCKKFSCIFLQHLWGFAWPLFNAARDYNMITVMNGELEQTQMVLQWWRLNPQVHLYGSTSPVFSVLWKIYGCPDTLTSSLKHLLLKKLTLVEKRRSKIIYFRPRRELQYRGAAIKWRGLSPSILWSSVIKLNAGHFFDRCIICADVVNETEVFFLMIQNDLQSCLRHQTVSSFIFRSRRVPCFWSSKDMNTGGKTLYNFH